MSGSGRNAAVNEVLDALAIVCKAVGTFEAFAELVTRGEQRDVANDPVLVAAATALERCNVLEGENRERSFHEGMCLLNKAMTMDFNDPSWMDCRAALMPFIDRLRAVRGRLHGCMKSLHEGETRGRHNHNRDKAAIPKRAMQALEQASEALESIQAMPDTTEIVHARVVAARAIEPVQAVLADMA